MTFPHMILPSYAMPWGREIQALAENTKRDIENANQGSDFPQRADNIAGQIKAVQVNTVRRIDLAPFSGTVSGGFTDPWTNVVTGPFNFSSDDGASTKCVVILNFHVDATTGDAPNIPIMKVNGNVFTDWNHISRMPPSVFSEGYYAMQATVDLAPGEPISLEYGLKVPPVPLRTFTVNRAVVWLAFYGSVT